MEVRGLAFALVGSVAVAGLCGQSFGVYSGLSTELYSTVTADGASRSVWRVYANFNNPNDALYSVYGSPTLGALVIESRNSTNTGAGSAFYNPALGTNHAPSLASIGGNPNVAWDTFATIGVAVSDQAPFGDQTSFSPGFPNIAGTSVTSTNAAWYVTPTMDEDGNPGTPAIDNPQAQAGFAGDGDLLNRVLLLQLTVNAGDNVRGTANLVVFNAAGGAQQILSQQTFSSIPAPGALGLLALAGLRRRRRS